jgi:hypothetical protein
MANLKLIKVTGSPFCSTFYGCIGIRATDNQFQIIKDGRLHGQSSHIGTGWKYATAEEIEESWDAIYPHWKPEVGDNVIVTQDYGDWIGCKATIFEKDSTGTDYYRVEREDGSMSTFDYTSQMILAPYVKHYIEPKQHSLDGFKLGDRVESTEISGATIGKKGSVVHFDQGYIGVCFDEDIGGHNCNGHCPYGRGRYLQVTAVKHYFEPEKPEKPPRRFKVGDKVTYKSLAQCNGGYNYGGEDQTGFVGIVESEMSYESDKGCYGLRVTTKGGDYCYNMLESEFHEYDFGYVPITSGAIGSSQPATRLVIKGSSAAPDGKHILVGGVAYPIRLDSSDGSTHSTIASIDSDPLSSYKQKPITIKPKPKTKLTTI